MREDQQRRFDRQTELAALTAHAKITQALWLNNIETHKQFLGAEEAQAVEFRTIKSACAMCDIGDVTGFASYLH